MTKNIIIGILVLVSAFFIVLSNIKAEEAEKQTLAAEVSLRKAEENEAKAREQEQKATEAAAKALIEQRKTENLQAQLDKCK